MSSKIDLKSTHSGRLVDKFEGRPNGAEEDSTALDGTAELDNVPIINAVIQCNDKTFSA